MYTAADFDICMANSKHTAAAHTMLQSAEQAGQHYLYKLRVRHNIPKWFVLHYMQAQLAMASLIVTVTDCY